MFLFKLRVFKVREYSKKHLCKNLPFALFHALMAAVVAAMILGNYIGQAYSNWRALE